MSEPRPQTIRELLSDAWPDISTILDLVEDERIRVACFRLEKRFIDALDLLDNAEPHEWWDNRTEHTSENPWVGRLVPDRAPRGDAE